MAPEKFRIPVDKSKPGQYLPVTRDTHPERFDDSRDERQTAARARAAFNDLILRTIYGSNVSVCSLV